MKKKNTIWIGGGLYSKEAKYRGFPVKIVSYDVNTERHITIEWRSGDQERIELDNDQLELTDL